MAKFETVAAQTTMTDSMRHGVKSTFIRNIALLGIFHQTVRDIFQKGRTLMQYIILIGDETLTLDSVKSIIHCDSVNSYDVTEINNRYCVNFGSDHIFYDYEGSSTEDYEENDLKRIPFTKPNFIVMVYTSKERMKKVIQQENFLQDIYIDNDLGLIVPLEEFIKYGMPLDGESN